MLYTKQQNWVSNSVKIQIIDYSNLFRTGMRTVIKPSGAEIRPEMPCKK